MSNKAREGELYRRVSAFGKTFDLYYGYYEDFERNYADPIPIYPDFLSDPQYTDIGYPLATQMQDMCERGRFRRLGLEDRCCGNCIYFTAGDDLFGICTCESNRNPTDDHKGGIPDETDLSRPAR